MVILKILILKTIFIKIFKLRIKKFLKEIEPIIIMINICLNFILDKVRVKIRSFRLIKRLIRK